MKKLIIITFLSILVPVLSTAQPVKGLIYADTSGILVVKVWGTHQERGYALGYLTGDRITDVIINYVKPEFGLYYATARSIVSQGNDITIPEDYLNEAQAVVDGMNAAGFNTGNLDQTDILVGNTFLDISNLLFMESGMNCSALMSWNDATAGTDLDGKSVITRHLDWEYSAVLNRNHIITVHFPQEPDESKWLLIGFSGMMSILSGFNPDFGAFQNMMDDYTAMGQHNKHYLPVWMALRKAVEAEDYNGDGERNVQDVRSALADCSNGFADGFLVSSLARSSPTDSLVALVAELAPSSPTHTFRSNSYPDSIPGDNLYTANYQIARNNLMHFCTRYNNIRAHIGDGQQIGLDTNWNLMRDWSHLTTNTQLMQFAPEMDYLRIAVRTGSQAAYLTTPIVFDLNDLFDNPSTGVSNHELGGITVCFPNPVEDILRFGKDPGPLTRLEVFDMTGKTFIRYDTPFKGETLDVSSLPSGWYVLELTDSGKVHHGKFVKK